MESLAGAVPFAETKGEGRVRWNAKNASRFAIPRSFCLFFQAGEEHAALNLELYGFQLLPQLGTFFFGSVPPIGRRFTRPTAFTLTPWAMLLIGTFALSIQRSKQCDNFLRQRFNPPEQPREFGLVARTRSRPARAQIESVPVFGELPQRFLVARIFRSDNKDGLCVTSPNCRVGWQCGRG